MWWLAMAAASHFSMIGFQLDMSSSDSMGAHLIKLAEDCPTIALTSGNQLCVIRDESGAELWIGLQQKPDGSAEMKTVNPAMRGKGKTAMSVSADISPAEWKPFEYRIKGELSGEVPFVVDLADPQEIAKFKPGAKLSLDITAFADEIEVFDSEKSYYASQESKQLKFASNHFIPSGLFSPDGKAGHEPTAHALFAGEILESELRKNRVGKGDYWWILVRTFDGALFNVVADPTDVSISPKPRGIVSGSFWLSARLSAN